MYDVFKYHMLEQLSKQILQQKNTGKNEGRNKKKNWDCTKREGHGDNYVVPKRCFIFKGFTDEEIHTYIHT